MKLFVVILTVFMLFRPLFPFVEYLVHYEYIKTELCVNNDKPEMQCNGKCHLTKELANTLTSENSPTEPQKNFVFKFSFLFFEPIKELIKTFVFADPSPQFNAYRNLYTHSPIIYIFHPPR